MSTDGIVRTVGIIDAECSTFAVNAYSSTAIWSFAMVTATAESDGTGFKSTKLFLSTLVVDRADIT